jgi:hypothetical protein
MNSDLFLRGIARMELTFKSKLTQEDRRLYYRALAMLDDKQWEKVVVYALENWRRNSVPLPGQLREWCGIEAPTPAQEATQTVLPGIPILGDRSLSGVLSEAQAKGALSMDPGGAGRKPFWPDESTRMVYEDSVATVDPPIRIGSLMGVDEVLWNLQRISDRAQNKLAQMLEIEMRGER